MNQFTQNVKQANQANNVTTLEEAKGIAYPSHAEQMRSISWMPYQKDMLQKAEDATRFTLEQLEKTQQQLDQVQQQLLTKHLELENLQLRDQLRQYQTQKNQKDQNKKKLACQLSGLPVHPGWRTTQAMYALSNRCRSFGDSGTTPETHAPFDSRKAMAKQNARETDETNSLESESSSMLEFNEGILKLRTALTERCAKEDKYLMEQRTREADRTHSLEEQEANEWDALWRKPELPTVPSDANTLAEIEVSSSNGEGDCGHSLGASSPTRRGQREERDLLVPDPSLQGGDCFC